MRNLIYDGVAYDYKKMIQRTRDILISIAEDPYELLKQYPDITVANLSSIIVENLKELGGHKNEYVDFYKDKQEDPEYVNLSIGLDTDEILAVAPIFRCFLRPFCMASGTDALMSNVLVSSCMSRYETMDRSEDVNEGDFHASVTLSYMFNGKIPRDESIYHFIHISLLAQVLLVLGDCRENSNVFKKVSELLHIKEENK